MKLFKINCISYLIKVMKNKFRNVGTARHLEHSPYILKSWSSLTNALMVPIRNPSFYVLHRNRFTKDNNRYFVNSQTCYRIFPNVTLRPSICISHRTQYISQLWRPTTAWYYTYVQNYVKCLLFLFDFDQNQNVSTRFSETEISSSSFQCESRSSMLQKDEQTGGRK